LFSEQLLRVDFTKVEIINYSSGTKNMSTNFTERYTKGSSFVIELMYTFRTSSEIYIYIYIHMLGESEREHSSAGIKNRSNVTRLFHPLFQLYCT